MTARRYMIIRGELLDDPSFAITAHGGELVSLRLGVRMPGSLGEPVNVEAGDVMPSYCRTRRLEQGDVIVVSGWAQDADARTGCNVVMLQADMIAAHTSLDWREPS